MKAESEKSNSKGPYFFFVIFFIVGLIVFSFLTLPMLLNIYQARDWVKIQCNIEHARVTTHKGGDNDTYKINVVYSYKYQGHNYQSDRYSFLEGSSSGYSEKAQVVNRLNSKKNISCFVNPKNPQSAVLNRNFQLLEGSLSTAIPLLFILVGSFGIFFTFKKQRRKEILCGAYDYDIIEKHFDNQKGMDLKPHSTAFKHFIAFTFIALFWNGIISIFATDAIQIHIRGNLDFFDWIFTIFLIPFLLVGLFLICLAFKKFLALFNSTPKVQANNKILRQGENLKFTWQFSSIPKRFNKLSVKVECIKTYQVETEDSTKICESFIHTIDVAEYSLPIEMQNGSATVSLPEDAQVTELNDYPKFTWTIKFIGEIKNFPNMEISYAFAVIPKRNR